jgi:hypothetical protein
MEQSKTVNQLFSYYKILAQETFSGNIDSVMLPCPHKLEVFSAHDPFFGLK